ncbi:MAG: ParB/RepB/Spo0J family partition protein [Aestuariivirga sp.]|uniref:ParB/RepB/Spo0J family partition protein n=1 Tax=Aestuariivirga sp. TaxID=2650926 RepID=UPI0025C5F167|nr:ParB/RepB/Spo0J family partition protein [Aestuariivirga sp.]MCA3561348.1 ParB/RepB/Spo0J family partition protein [Aestuariivirga sp.]
MDMGIPQKKRLGRGLAALIGEDTSEEAVVQDVRTLRHMPIELLKASPNNPRKNFAEADLEDLSKSIREKGLLQPIVVRPIANGEYEIVAGERRWRAAQRAGVHDVPVLIRDLTDGEALEIALIENIQRSDLNSLEEARAYSMLLEQFSYTQQQLADSIGKSRSHIANTLRLLNLPEAVRAEIEQGRLTAGHARALVATDSPAELAARIIKLGLSVREAENLAREALAPKKQKIKPEKDADTRALEKLVSEAIGLKLEITHRRDGSGNMVISYKTLDQLEDVCRRLQKLSAIS